MIKDLIRIQVLIAAICISFTACTPTNNRLVVGEIQRGEFVITMNLDSLETAWDQVKDAQGNKVDYESFYIREDIIQGTDETYYMLISDVWDGEVKTQTGTELILKDGKFYFPESTGF